MNKRAPIPDYEYGRRKQCSFETPFKTDFVLPADVAAFLWMDLRHIRNIALGNLRHVISPLNEDGERFINDMEVLLTCCLSMIEGSYRFSMVEPLRRQMERITKAARE